MRAIRMLSDGQALAMEEWVTAANAWGEAAQGMVGAASGLGTASRSLADAVGGVSRAAGDARGAHENGLGTSLRSLAEEVEADTSGLRNRYLETAANLDQYREILGRVRGD